MDFSKEYSSNKFYWGLNPHKIIKKTITLITAGKVLDIGVGEGKNSVFLAKKGFSVEGLDISKEGILKVKKLSDSNNVKISTKCIDIRKFNFKTSYDLIISTFTLHFLNRKDRKEVINKMKEHTKKNGFNVITVFTKEVPDYSPNLEKKYNLTLFKKNELRELFSDWNIIEYSEIFKLDKSHGDPHYHSIASIIAKKN